MCFVFFVFFFQAEDGIRDAQESRGLGDVYKRQVIKENPSQVEAYLGGKEKLFGFFVGQVMKLTEGKANPKSVNAILKEKLK